MFTQVGLGDHDRFDLFFIDKQGEGFIERARDRDFKVLPGLHTYGVSRRVSLANDHRGLPGVIHQCFRYEMHEFFVEGVGVKVEFEAFAEEAVGIR